jgi:hypothetical protein
MLNPTKWKPQERLVIFSLRAIPGQTAQELLESTGSKTLTYLQSALRTLYLAGIIDHRIVDGEVRYSLAAPKSGVSTGFIDACAKQQEAIDAQAEATA